MTDTVLRLRAEEIRLGMSHFGSDRLVDHPDARFCSSSSSRITRRGVWSLLEPGGTFGGPRIEIRWGYDDVFAVHVTPFCHLCGNGDGDEPLIEDDLPDTELHRWRHQSCSYTALGAAPNPWKGFLR